VSSEVMKPDGAMTRGHLARRETVQNDEKRWFRVRGTITIKTEAIIRAATREEAEVAYWDVDELDQRELLHDELLEVEECEMPLR
jgi:hypothetical protein